MNPVFLWGHIDILFASLLVVVAAKVPFHSSLPLVTLPWVVTHTETLKPLF
jgi:hypothetical protein